MLKTHKPNPETFVKAAYISCPAMLKKGLLPVLLLILLSIPGGSRQSVKDIDLVFCIDMSGSTNGLLPDFRARMWEVVNGISRMRPFPRLRIGLVGFSRPSFGKANSYVKVLCEFTDDYDKISYSLGQLKPSVEKGDQYVGAALEAAYKMNWTDDPAALRVICLMGNGSVSTGGFIWRNTCENLLKKNIVVNSIYCFQQRIVNKEIAGWKSIADLTGGDFSTCRIGSASAGKARVELKTLTGLNNRFNKTYIYAGSEGKLRMESLLDADLASMQHGGNYFYSRLLYKISEHYQSGQSGWDLVNFVKSSGLNFSSLDRTFFPDSIKNMEDPTLSKVVLAKKDERARVISEIRSCLATAGLDTLQPDPAQLQGMIVHAVRKSGNAGTVIDTDRQ